MTSDWPDSAAAPGEAVDCVVFASQSSFDGPVLAEMHRIRDHALRRNVADGVHVALLHQSGWFVEWIEGPPAGVQALMERVAPDARHRGLLMLHSSHGPSRLTELWSLAIVQTHELPTDFARRVVILHEEHQKGLVLQPATVWRRLSTPLTHPGAAEQAVSDRFQRVMVCSARGVDSFDLVHWLGQAHNAEVVQRRFAGSHVDRLDVATDYVDIDSGAVVRRVIAMARNGLEIGLTQAFLPDYSHMILLLSGDGACDGDLMKRLVAACARLAHRPVVVGLGPPSFNHALLQQIARRGRLIYLDCDLAGHIGAQSCWDAAEPLLNLSLAANADQMPR
ncbi:MAG: BLUF domain-containing protein [Polaromonas sp.]